MLTVEDAEIMESGGVPERTHVSQTTYIRAVKDSTLKFEKLDRLPEEGYPKEKGQTYLAIVPNDVEAWLNGVCGDADIVEDQIVPENHNQSYLSDLVVSLVLAVAISVGLKRHFR